LSVRDVWARASIGPAKAGAAYLTVANGGDAPAALIGAETPVARKAMLHESRMQDGVMTMRHLMRVEVPAGGEIMLAPGGLHVMLMGLDRPLEEGERFPLTLRFEGQAPIDVTVWVAGATAREAPRE
jgi:hypothetical protein